MLNGGTHEQHSLRIVAIGDSTTAGTPGFLSPLEAPPNGSGNPESQYAYWMLRTHPEWVVLNRGVNGERSDDVHARFNQDVVAAKPDYVIILAGVNDIYEGATTSNVKTNLQSMYLEAKKAGIMPVAATILPYNTATEEEKAKILDVNKWIRQTTNQLDILYCDTNQAAADPRNPDQLSGSPEGLHPDVATYRSIGNALTRTIESHLSRG